MSVEQMHLGKRSAESSAGWMNASSLSSWLAWAWTAAEAGLDPMSRVERQMDDSKGEVDRQMTRKDVQRSRGRFQKSPRGVRTRRSTMLALTAGWRWVLQTCPSIESWKPKLPLSVLTWSLEVGPARRVVWVAWTRSMATQQRPPACHPGPP